MSLIDLLAIEYNTRFNRKKDPDKFTDEVIALCGLLDKYRVCPTRFAEDSRPMRSGLELLEIEE